MGLQPDGAGSSLHLPQYRLGARVGRIEKHGNTHGLGQQLTQKCQPFCDHLPGERIVAGRVAARSGEAGDKIILDSLLSGGPRKSGCPGVRPVKKNWCVQQETSLPGQKSGAL